MLRTVYGVYDHGVIRLTEAPDDIDQANVLVTFLTPASTVNAPSQIRYGQFSQGRKSQEEDFALAEWRGDADLDEDHGR
jgi:hypothetical protein